MKPEEFPVYCEGRGTHGRLELFRVWVQDGALVSEGGHRRTSPSMLTQESHKPSEVKANRDRAGLWAIGYPAAKEDFEGRSRWRLTCKVCLLDKPMADDNFRQMVETLWAAGRRGVDASSLPR